MDETLDAPYQIHRYEIVSGRFSRIFSPFVTMSASISLQPTAKPHVPSVDHYPAGRPDRGAERRFPP
ncbi:MAG: hypothetical protein KC445_13290, partial [Anaerolineales bacterium]|nr:hypothetical protein [Anaerolineales bacterium]